MPRKFGGPNTSYHTKQKGHSRRGTGIGSYAKKNKRRVADHYDRPYIDGTYRGYELKETDSALTVIRRKLN